MHWFLFLLYNAKRKDQYQRENCSPKSMQNTLMNTIKKLANTFLAPVSKYSEYDGQCIMILSEGEYFYKIFGNQKSLIYIKTPFDEKRSIFLLSRNQRYT